MGPSATCHHMLRVGGIPDTTNQFPVNAMVLDEHKAHLSESLVYLLQLRATGDVLSGEQALKIYNRDAVTQGHVVINCVIGHAS